MRLVCVALLAAACGGGGGGSDASVPGDDAGTWGPEDLAGACAQNTRSGTVELNHVAAATVMNGNFSARITDGIEPNEILTALEQDGDCRIYRKENFVCDTPCGGATACGPDGVCVPRPLLQDVGTIEVHGLGETLVVMNQANNYFDTTSLPNPPFAPGQRVRVVAPGATYPGFELRGIGVPIVELPDTRPLMARDAPFTVTWDTTGSLGDVRIKITVDQHGLTPTSLICITADDGTLDVSAATVNTFLDYGITGVPNYSVERRTADSIQTDDGCLELRVHSSVTGNFDVEGHTPCTVAMPDCPEPLVCDLATETCVAP